MANGERNIPLEVERFGTAVAGADELLTFPGRRRIGDQAVVPGLLQTREYAIEVVHASGVDWVEQHEERMTWWPQLSERNASVEAIVPEEALRRGFGDPRVMRDLLRHMIEIAPDPRATIQVLPQTAEVDDLLTQVGGHYVILGDASSGRMNRTLRRPDNNEVVDDPRKVGQALGVHYTLGSLALSVAQSLDALQHYEDGWAKAASR